MILLPLLLNRCGPMTAKETMPSGSEPNGTDSSDMKGIEIDVVLRSSVLNGQAGTAPMRQSDDQLQEEDMLVVDLCTSTLLTTATGYAQAVDHTRSRESGIDHHPVKPMDTRLMRDLLEKTDTGDRLSEVREVDGRE